MKVLSFSRPPEEHGYGSKLSKIIYSNIERCPNTTQTCGPQCASMILKIMRKHTLWSIYAPYV
jgi:hypothetical protein